MYTAAMTCTRTAFTFIEIMIVLVILSLVVALAIPSISDSDRTTLTSAAEMLQGDLAVAQIQSITNQADPRVVVFDTSAAKYHVGTVSSPSTPVPHPTGGGPYVVQFGVDQLYTLAGVTISGLSVGGDDQLGFETYGELDQTTAATITLSLNGKSITLTVDPDTGEAELGTIVE